MPARSPVQQPEEAIRVLLCEPHLEHGYAVVEAMAMSDDVFHVVHVDQLDEAMAELEREPPEVILVDIGALGPRIDAALLRIVSVSPNTSIVLICEPRQQDLAMEGIRHGGHDYVLRNLGQTGSLIRTVRSAISRQNGKNNLHYLAHHDVLTGLANRVLFARCLESALLKAAGSSRVLGVLFIDLDGFKPVNDQLGHDVGDELLKAIARRLRSNVSHADVVARMGGDEFAVLLEDLGDDRDARTVARRLMGLVQQPLHLAGRELQISCSIGVSTSRGNTSAPELIQSADAAMYQAKRSGGGIRSHQDDARQPVDTLDTALEQGELALYYQPQVGPDGELFGVEALLRWHRDGEVIGPNEFVPRLEESGLIVPVGEWVLQTALEQLLTWRRAGFRVPRVAVNVSPVQLQRSNLSTRVADLLTALDLPSSSLELEITERVVLSDHGRCRSNLEEIRSMGVCIALDDFGTGYSSLSYLLRYPVDTLKVDRSFVQDIETNPKSFSIVGSILDLGRRLGIVTVAEGGETRSQAEILRREGCHVLQGFLFGRPHPGTVDPRVAVH